MVELKPKGDREREISIVSDRHFRLKHLLLFILGSTLVHGLIFLLLVKYKATKQPVEETKSKPIEFVVVPPEEETEEPPETNNRANENSVAKSDIPPEKPASIPTGNELIPAPEVATEPIPEPEPIPTPEVATEPTPEPEPEPVEEPTPKPPANETISGADAPITPPEPVEEPVATRLPPEPQPPEPSNPGGSAADLLGGDYQKTLANSGDAFFSPEALTHKTVLNPSQIDALRDVELSAYFGEMKQQLTTHGNSLIAGQFTEKYTTVMRFVVEKNGQITGLKIVQSSGSEEFDRRSLETVKKSAPFPPLPPNFPLEVWSIEYRVVVY